MRRDLPGAAGDELASGRRSRAAAPSPPSSARERERGRLPRRAPDGRGGRRWWPEQVGELEVVEADQRDRGSRPPQRAQRADGVAVVGGEERGRAGRAQASSSRDGGLGRSASCVPSRTSAGSSATPGGAPAPRGSRRGARRRCSSSAGSATQAIRRWPWAIRCSTARRAPPRLSSSTVSASMPPRRAVEEDDRRAGLQLAAEVAVVVAGGDDQQRVDAAAQQRAARARARARRPRARRR